MSKLKPKDKVEMMKNFYEAHAKDFRGEILKGKKKNSLGFRFNSGKRIEVILLSSKNVDALGGESLNSLHELIYSLRNEGIPALVRFYKDRENFFIKTVEKGQTPNNKRLRLRKSLKKYIPDGSIYKIISLSDLERFVLFKYTRYLMQSFTPRDLKGLELQYYQPKTERLEEGIRRFSPREVYYDYSYKRVTNKGHTLPQEKLAQRLFFLDENRN